MELTDRELMLSMKHIDPYIYLEEAQHWLILNYKQNIH